MSLMSALSKHRSPFLTILTSATAALSVSACSNVFDRPHFWPTGYTYHNEEFKSATPEPSDKFTSLQRSNMGPEQAEQFRMSVYSLVQSLTARAGLPPKAVFVLQPEPLTPFYANIDNDLRESLRHSGYRLADQAGTDAYVFTYVANIIKQDKNAPAAAPGTPNVHLSLFVYDRLAKDARLLTEESGDFYIKGAEDLKVTPPKFKDLPAPGKAATTASAPSAPKASTAVPTSPSASSPQFRE